MVTADLVGSGECQAIRGEACPMTIPIANGPRRTALITGASGGIGAELALLFARDGYDLVLVARSPDKLARLAERLERDHPISVRALLQDLTQPEAPAQIHAELTAASARIDVLVNNA